LKLIINSELLFLGFLFDFCSHQNLFLLLLLLQDVVLDFVYFRQEQQEVALGLVIVVTHWPGFLDQHLELCISFLLSLLLLGCELGIVFLFIFILFDLLY